MKATLLDRITWYPSPKIKRTGIVVGISWQPLFQGRSICDELIEVYDVAHDRGLIELNACCFLNLEKREKIMIEELLTHRCENLQWLGLYLTKRSESLDSFLESNSSTLLYVEEFLSILKQFLKEGKGNEQTN